MPTQCIHPSPYTSMLIQLLVSSILAVVAFMTDNVTVLVGAMLISPIGSVVLNTALSSRPTLSPNIVGAMLGVPILVGIIGGLLTNSVDLPTIQNAGANIGSKPVYLLTSAIIAVTCGILFPVLTTIPSVGIDVATQLLPPIVACGYLLGFSVKKRRMMYSVGGCLVLFLVYAIGLYVAAVVTSKTLCAPTKRPNQ